jgi:hypothetical protein
MTASKLETIVSISNHVFFHIFLLIKYQANIRAFLHILFYSITRPMAAPNLATMVLISNFKNSLIYP